MNWNQHAVFTPYAVFSNKNMTMGFVSENQTIELS